MKTQKHSTVTFTATEIVLPGLVDPSGLQFRERSLPPLAHGHALVQVEATGVSFAEQSMRRGLYPAQPAFPFVPGYDFVGRIVAVGSGVPQSRIGTRVAAVTKIGGWASHVAVAAENLGSAGASPRGSGARVHCRRRRTEPGQFRCTTGRNNRIFDGERSAGSLSVGRARPAFSRAWN